MIDVFLSPDSTVESEELLKPKSSVWFKEDGQKNLLSICCLYSIIYKEMPITKTLILNHLELDMSNSTELPREEEELIEPMEESLLIWALLSISKFGLKWTQPMLPSQKPKKKFTPSKNKLKEEEFTNLPLADVNLFNYLISFSLNFFIILND